MRIFWKKLLEKYGFGKTVCDHTMVRNGDPSKNTMMRFINHKPVASKATQAAEMVDVREEKARTVLHAQERFKMQYQNNKKSEILKLRERLNEINDLQFSEIEFIEDDGSVIEVNQNITEEWKYTGLSNCDFITTGYYTL